jgi:hypothetical protein
MARHNLTRNNLHQEVNLNKPQQKCYDVSELQKCTNKVVYALTLIKLHSLSLNTDESCCK